MRRLNQIAELAGSVLTVEDAGLCADDGFSGRLRLSGTQPLRVVASWGLGWDHVSVSLPHRCPTWAEMCVVRRLFFWPEETVVQFHPPESEYVNCHPYCLHLWRPQAAEIPRPPAFMVGPQAGAADAV